MKHLASPQFWQCYQALPPEVRELADKNYQLLKADPDHPSLRFKKVGRYWSARVGKYYPALALEITDGLLWFWIGNHAEYNRLVNRV